MVLATPCLARPSHSRASPCQARPGLGACQATRPMPFLDTRRLARPYLAVVLAMPGKARPRRTSACLGARLAEHRQTRPRAAPTGPDQRSRASPFHGACPTMPGAAGPDLSRPRQAGVLASPCRAFARLARRVHAPVLAKPGLYSPYRSRQGQTAPDLTKPRCLHRRALPCLTRPGHNHPRTAMPRCLPIHAAPNTSFPGRTERCLAAVPARPNLDLPIAASRCRGACPDGRRPALTDAD